LQKPHDYLETNGGKIDRIDPRRMRSVPLIPFGRASIDLDDAIKDAVAANSMHAVYSARSVGDFASVVDNDDMAPIFTKSHTVVTVKRMTPSLTPRSDDIVLVAAGGRPFFCLAIERGGDDSLIGVVITHTTYQKPLVEQVVIK
jgi:hypothetical protein